jgi:hypothetical protein
MEYDRGIVMKEWSFEFENHQIRVTNSWFRGAKLYIDGVLRATNRSLIANPGQPAFTAPLADGKGPIVEVFFEAVMTVKAKIVIDGKKVSGDLA